MSTGVRILPRNSNGYMFDGLLLDYQATRGLIESLAKSYPELIPDLRQQAETINRTHLRRLLAKATWGQESKWWIENMPRWERRLWRGVDTKRVIATSTEYLATMDNLLRGKKGEKVLRGFYSQ